MRVLIVQISSLEGVVHAMPVISDLCREFPKLAIDCCVEESFAAIVRLHPAVDRILPIATQRWRRQLFSANTWREIQDFRRALKAADYDAVLDLHGTFFSALLARQACGPTCGYDLAAAQNPRAARFYDAAFLIPKNVNAVERKRWLAAAAIELPLETPLDYGISAAPLTADWLPEQPYVAFAPGRPDRELVSRHCERSEAISSGARRKTALLRLPRAFGARNDEGDLGFGAGDETIKQGKNEPWPEANWIELGQALQKQGNAIVLIAESEEERARAVSIVAAIPDAIIAPPLGAEAMAGLLAGAVGSIGENNGLTHLAAALGCPVVNILAADEPEFKGILGAAPFRNFGGQGTIPQVAAVLNAFLTCRRQ